MSKKRTERYRSYNIGDIMQNDLLDAFEAIYIDDEDPEGQTVMATRIYMEALKVGEDEDTQEQIDLCLQVALTALAGGDFGFSAWVIFSVKDGLLKRKLKKEQND